MTSTPSRLDDERRWPTTRWSLPAMIDGLTGIADPKDSPELNLTNADRLVIWAAVRHLTEEYERRRAAESADGWVPWKPGDALPAEGKYWVTRQFADGYATYINERLFAQVYSTSEWGEQPMHPIVAYWSRPLPPPYAPSSPDGEKGR